MVCAFTYTAIHIHTANLHNESSSWMENFQEYQGVSERIHCLRPANVQSTSQVCIYNKIHTLVSGFHQLTIHFFLGFSFLCSCSRIIRFSSYSSGFASPFILDPALSSLVSVFLAGGAYDVHVHVRLFVHARNFSHVNEFLLCFPSHCSPLSLAVWHDSVHSLVPYNSIQILYTLE